MKKLICSLLFALVLIPQIKAQTVIQDTSSANSGMSGDIGFGVKAGLNASTFIGNGYTNITPAIGAYVGGLAEIPAFMDDFYLQPEIMVSFQGADLGPRNLNLIYLHLPLMAKYHITDEIAAEFGPQLSFLLADNWDDNISELDTTKFNIGLNFGGGYRLNENLYFQLRFNLGFTKIIEQTSIKNGVIQIGASYFF